jgi:hypothetical protein
VAQVVELLNAGITISAAEIQNEIRSAGNTDGLIKRKLQQKQ